MPLLKYLWIKLLEITTLGLGVAEIIVYDDGDPLSSLTIILPAAWVIPTNRDHIPPPFEPDDPGWVDIMDMDNLIVILRLEGANASVQGMVYVHLAASCAPYTGCLWVDPKLMVSGYVDGTKPMVYYFSLNTEHGGYLGVSWIDNTTNGSVLVQVECESTAKPFPDPSE